MFHHLLGGLMFLPLHLQTGSAQANETGLMLCSGFSRHFGRGQQVTGPH
jgi:hypothetical protein